MNTKQLRYVQVLAAEGSFSRASEVLNISQPSLSQYIKKIEQENGVILFDRTGGNVRITDAGRVYIEVGREILDLEHQMQLKFTDLAVYKSGTINIGCAPYRSAGFMPEIARRFRAQYPGVRLVIGEHVKDELVERMEHGEFDLCVTTAPVDPYLFDFEPIMEEEILLAVPKDGPDFETVEMPGRKYPAVKAEQIGGKSFVTLTENQVMQQAFDQMLHAYHVKTDSVVVVKSLEAQIAMVRAGVGMAVVPSGIEHFCGKDEVRFYSFVQDLPRREVLAIRRKNIPLSETVHDLIRIMKEIDP